MIAVVADYPKLTVEEVKKQNNNMYNHVHDKYNKEYDKEAIKCFLNSLNKELCKDNLLRTEDSMKFSKVFMIFIEHEQPQHRELHDTIKQELLNINIGRFLGTNIKEMCVKMQMDVKALVKENQFDSKHNAKICQILAKA